MLNFLKRLVDKKEAPTPTPNAGTRPAGVADKTSLSRPTSNGKPRKAAHGSPPVSLTSFRPRNELIFQKP